MAIDHYTSPYEQTGVSTTTRNRVLRNTYWLLALSMIPTVLGSFNKEIFT